MPLVRIDLAAGKSEQYRHELGEIVHQAMTELIGVPVDDKFQIVTEHPPGGLNITPSYLGIAYSSDIVLIQITLNEGRTVELKKALYQRIAETLQADLGLSPEDVLISLVEVRKENWSFGNGEMQYAPAPV